MTHRPLTTDAALVRWCTERDSDARDQVVRAYAPLVEATVCALIRRMPSHIDADDLRACGMLGLITALDRYSLENGAAFATFARPRVRGAMLDHLRRQAPAGRTRDVAAVAASLPGVVVEEDDPALMVDGAEEIRLLRQAIDALDERDKTIVRLHHMENWTLRRIAELLDVSEGRISRLHSRALERLATQMTA